MKGRTVLFPSLLLLAATLLAPAPAPASNATATGVSRDFNPAISVNALLLYRSGLAEPEADNAAGDAHVHGATGDGFSVQEAEMQLTSIIDPYAKADLVFAMHGTEGFELEEGIVRLLSLPRGLGLRTGKFYYDFGKHNTYHTHQYPFVERPYAWAELLGEEGLNGAAVEASWLTPLPWYADVIAYGFPLIEPIYGDHEIPANAWGGGARLRQLWDATDQTTLEIGGSYAGGSETGDATRHFVGADVTLKWTGTGRNPKRLEVQSEWFRRIDDLAEDDVHADGFYVHALGRLTRRFVLGGRFDLYRPAEPLSSVLAKTASWEEADDVSTWTGSIAYVPSEFQAVRAEFLYRHAGGDFGDGEKGVRLQYDFTIGSHPAHRYSCRVPGIP